MEQLTYESSTSEDDIQIVKHDSCNNEADSDDHGVAPAKREKINPKAKKKVGGAAVYKTKCQPS